MKALCILLLITSISLAQNYKFDRSVDVHEDCRKCDGMDISWNDREIDDGDFLLYDDNELILEITHKGELKIDNKRIQTTRKQRRLLKNYVDAYAEIIELGIIVGKDGAQIGVTAVKEVFSALATLDSDEIEERMEKMEKKIERNTRDIEKHARQLEDIAEEFSDIRCDLLSSISKLNHVDGF